MKFATGRIALAVRSRALGLAAGMPMDKIVKSFENGNGCTLGHIAVVVGLGTMLGKAAQFVGSAGGHRVRLVCRVHRTRPMRPLRLA
ncbi:MAG TPA: hypothetical protein VNZ04_10395 [Trinickia sp.]|nr:hypothetical protein [Trinickia sp.]